jgi:hypothetical protein
MQTTDHVWDEDNFLFGKKMMSSRRLGSHSLCKDCNNKTGAWYAKEFCDFAKQGMAILLGAKLIHGLLEGIYTLKPLNVFRQIMAMFMSADKSGYLRIRGDIREYLLNGENRMLPSDLQIFIYSNASPFKRLSVIQS